MRPGFATALSLLLAWNTRAVAKPPTLDSLFPPGGQRGQSVTVTAAGSFGQWPVKVWMEGQGLEVRPLADQGKLAIDVASDAPVGVHWIRLIDEEGATAPRPFLVGTLPEVLEAEPNNDPTRPQRLDAPAVTVNGKLDRAGDVDGFAVPLRKDQTLVAALEANRRLGTPMDGVLQVVSADGFVLAQNDDAPDRDPLIVFTPTADATYLVRVFAFPAEPDSRIGFSGGESYLYRLTLTTGGFLDHVYPLAVARAAPGRVEAVGWNIPESARALEVAAADDMAGRVAVDHRLLANAGEVRLEPHPATVEVEPNPQETPQDVALPATITGRIDPPGDQDAYRFPAKQGEKWQIQVESRGLGHPLDALLRVLDASGKVLSEMDDPGRRRDSMRDPELTFTAPADGAYRIIVRDLNGQGSFRHVYLLTAAAPVPDFTLTMAADRFTLTPGTPLKIPLTVARDDGFAGTVAVEALGLPDDVSAPRVSSAPTGASAKAVTLELTASQGPWSGPFRIVGRVADGEPKSRAARASLVGSNASTEHPWLTVLKPSAPAKGAAVDEKDGVKKAIEGEKP